jgi:hypothetical protein
LSSSRRTSASWNGCGRSANQAAGIFIAPQGVRLGKRFARALVISTLESETQHGDAFRLLGFSKLATLRELGHRLGWCELRSAFALAIGGIGPGYKSVVAGDRREPGLIDPA